MTNKPTPTTIHVTFTHCTEVWRRVNGVPVPEPPDRGYDPRAFVLLKDEGKPVDGNK